MKTCRGCKEKETTIVGGVLLVDAKTGRKFPPLTHFCPPMAMWVNMETEAPCAIEKRVLATIHDDHWTDEGLAKLSDPEYRKRVIHLFANLNHP